jgi:hypothetical protein
MNIDSKLSQQPIFIIGFPRSGTTLLQSFICTQKIESFPETHFFNKVVPQRGSLIKIEDISEILLRLDTWFELKLSEVTLREVKILANNKKLTKKFLFEIVITEYFNKKSINFNINTMWLEKTPSHCFRLEEILACYPEAKFVAIVRNPVFSIFSYCKKLVKYRKPYMELARLWKKTNNSIINFQAKYNNKLYVIKYEDLIKDPNEEMTSLFNFLNLDYRHEQLKEYQKISQKFILSNETWKNDNKKSIKVVDIDPTLSMSLFDRLSIQMILMNEFKLYGYEMKMKNLVKLIHPLKQLIFTMKSIF